MNCCNIILRVPLHSSQEEMPACRKVKRVICILLGSKGSYSNKFVDHIGPLITQQEHDAVRHRNKIWWLLMSCQLTAALWRQIAFSSRARLSSGCHQLFIPLSTHSLNHLPTGLMVVVLWTITHTTYLLHTSAHMYAETFRQTHPLNCYLHSFSHSLCPTTPNIWTLSNENKMFVFSQDRG